MEKIDVLELRHSIETAGEMTVAAILLAAGLVASGWWSISGFAACALWVAGSYGEQEKRKRRLRNIPPSTDSGSNVNG